MKTSGAHEGVWNLRWLHQALPVISLATGITAPGSTVLKFLLTKHLVSLHYVVDAAMRSEDFVKLGTARSDVTTYLAEGDLLVAPFTQNDLVNLHVMLLDVRDCVQIQSTKFTKSINL